MSGILPLEEDLGVALSSQGRSAALRAEPVPVSGLRPAAANAGAERDRLLAMARKVTLAMISGDDMDETLDEILP